MDVFGAVGESDPRPAVEFVVEADVGEVDVEEWPGDLGGALAEDPHRVGASLR
jgi:hypothetical protein